MISERMKPYVNNNSAIRAMFEEGNRLKALYGEDKVLISVLGIQTFRHQIVFRRQSLIW